MLSQYCITIKNLNMIYKKRKNTTCSARGPSQDLLEWMLTQITFKPEKRTTHTCDQKQAPSSSPFSPALSRTMMCTCLTATCRTLISCIRSCSHHDGSDYMDCEFSRKFEETLAYHSPNTKPVQLADIVVC
jgi:hypothetical protein